MQMEGIHKLHKRKGYPVLELTQFRDFYENQLKNEELITNKPWTIYTSSNKYKPRSYKWPSSLVM